MKRKFIWGAGFGLLLFVSGASASSVPLDVSNNYIFPLAGGGGGAMATLNGVSVEIFCDDFANSINFGSDYLADVTTLGTTANLSETRFGEVTSWETIGLNTGNTTLDNNDDTFFNSGAGSSALARYEMVAYLVSQYNTSLGDNTSNNQIQEAIWTLMDPTSEGQAINPDWVNASSYLEQAENWYTTMNESPALLNTFLSRVEVVSPTSMTGHGTFQEQIVITPTPEPRGTVWMLLSLLGIGLLVLRRRTAVESVGCANA